MPDQTLTESEVAALLSCISLIDSVKPGSVHALTRFSAVAGAGPALDLIEASGTAGLLLPLVTALRQEMGEESRVAKEVAEVASDVQRQLVEIRASLRLGPLTATAKLEMGNSS